MTVCVWGGVVGGQCLLYIINMHFILLKLRNKKPFFNDCSAHLKKNFFTCNNVMFLSQPIRNLWIHNPIGYTMNLKSIINPRNIKNKMNILSALFLVILVCFQKSPPFCLPLNIIINPALLIFSPACSPLHTSTKCSSLTSVWFYGQQAVGSQCRTQNMIRFPQKWSTRTETLFLPTRPWATPSIPAKVIFCHWVGWPAKIMPHINTR